MARLDDYVLGRALAQGGMGVVHEAVERATGRRVALKRVLPGALDRDALARFAMEGRAVARLSHPGIVRVHALEETPAGPFMVMDLVAGPSLQRVLDREGPLAPAHALALARELAHALAHAHERGVLHRDLKPANVLVDETGAPRLIDFGLAKMLGGAGSLAHLTRTGELVGTPTFMAPEQANGGATDARTDVYGLGATLFALLTGRPPFAGATALAVMYAVLSQAPTPPSRVRAGLSPAVDALVLACLAKDPAARPSSMAEVLARLDGLDGEVPRRPSRSWALAAAVVAAALVLAGVAASVRPEPAIPPGPSIAAPTSRALPARPVVPVTAWLERAHELARAGDIAAALAPPPAGAPSAAWLDHGRALLSAGRLIGAVAALRNDALVDRSREVVLARFRAALALDPATADPRALDAELHLEPTWTRGVFEREVHRLRTSSSDPLRLREARQLLAERGASDLAARLGAEAARAVGNGAEVDEALAALERAIAEDPRQALLFVERAELLRLVPADRRAEREADLTQALALDPLLARAYGLRGEVRQLLDDLDGAAADLLERATLLGPSAEAADALVTAAACLVDVQRFEEALDALGAARDHGLDARTERVRGDGLRGLGKRTDAIAAYERVFSVPGDPGDYEAAAEGLRALGQGEIAWDARYFELLHQRDVRTPEPWLALARARRAENPQLAEAAASQAIDHGGGSSALRLRAELRMLLGRHDGALSDWNDVVTAVPDNVLDRVQRAQARSSAGDDAGALEDLDRAVVDSEGEPELAPVVLEARSRLREHLGALEGALVDARALSKLLAGTALGASAAARVADLERRLATQR